MAKKIYLVSHGLRYNGANPGHTPEGLDQIRALPLLDRAPLAVSGTGRRFLEILEILLLEKMRIERIIRIYGFWSLLQKTTPIFAQSGSNSLFL